MKLIEGAIVMLPLSEQVAVIISFDNQIAYVDFDEGEGQGPPLDLSATYVGQSKLYTDIFVEEL